MLDKSDIIVYIPVYNDDKALIRCLNKLNKLGLKALVTDGRFTDFPQINNSDHSTDDTKNTCWSFGADYYWVKPMREEEKLNLSMIEAHKRGYKVFIYIGADAYLEGDIDEFLVNLTREYERFVTGPTMLQIEAVETQPDAKWNNTSTRQPRILLNYNQMEARHLHWAMFEKGMPDDMPLAGQQIIVRGLKIIHDNTVRPKERDDMMTEYQDNNVPRERQLFMDKIAKKKYAHIKILTYNLNEGSYSDARQMCLHQGYSHLLLLKEGTDKSEWLTNLFLKYIKLRNTNLENIPVLTAVWDAGNGKISLDITEKYKDHVPKYNAVKKLYSKEGLEPTGKFMGIGFITGPVVCMDRETVALIDNMGTELDFMKFCNQLGLRVEAIPEIKI